MMAYPGTTSLIKKANALFNFKLPISGLTDFKSKYPLTEQKYQKSHPCRTLPKSSAECR